MCRPAQPALTELGGGQQGQDPSSSDGKKEDLVLTGQMAEGDLVVVPDHLGALVLENRVKMKQT